MNSVGRHEQRVLDPRAMDVQISVVVSTCNRARELPRLFAALRDQTINGRTVWELIVVDNRSTDDTAEVVQSCAAESNFPVIYTFEGRQGKSFGLNTGVTLARGKIIAFTDDDGVPAPDWLENIVRHFETHPNVACVGGRVELYDPADALITVRLSQHASLVDASNFAVSNIPVIGCNMAIDAQALRTVGPYDTDIGPGSRIGVAEDVDMLYRVVRAGHRIGYEPRLLVLHNHGRRAANEMERVVKGYVIGRGAFYCKYMLQADRKVARWAYWEVAGLLSRWLRSGLLTPEARESMRTVGLLLDGAVRYLRYRQARSVEGTGV